MDFKNISTTNILAAVKQPHLERKHIMKKSITALTLLALSALPGMQTPSVMASSHMDAPQITFDDPANTTDVYAFVSDVNGEEYLTTALGVYPFEEPGIGPNNYRFDDNVLYEIHVAIGDKDLKKGRKTLSYQFRFDTKFKNKNTILQSFLSPLEGNIDNKGFDVNQNLRQTYKVTKVDHRYGYRRGQSRLGSGHVPPNNQGLLTRFYNQENNGENPAKNGVDDENNLDQYTQRAIAELNRGYRAFAGQRDDGFYADIQSIFDLDLTFAGPNKPFDSQGGFNIHTIVLQIPISEIGGSNQIVGVYATTSRAKFPVLGKFFGKFKKGGFKGHMVQVARQGAPLFNEAFIANKDKDRYSRTSPTQDKQLFEQYALTPELVAVLQPLFDLDPSLLTNRFDLAGIFIPDMIKVDLSTGPARLADNGDATFHRLGIFGGDTLQSTVQPGLFGDGTVSGGFPNGRRFGDDVIDITVIAGASDLRVSPPLLFNDGNTAGLNIDKVAENDITFNAVMPYAATPQNGRNHPHH